jgi:hypothetical protein
MTSGVTFTPAEIAYLERHRDEWPSVLAYQLNSLFGSRHTERGVRARLKRLSAVSPE